MKPVKKFDAMYPEKTIPNNKKRYIKKKNPQLKDKHLACYKSWWVRVQLQQEINPSSGQRQTKDTICYNDFATLFKARQKSLKVG